MLLYINFYSQQKEKKLQLELKRGDEVRLEASPKGCSRSIATKINQKGPEFKVLLVRRNCQQLRGVPGVLVQSLSTQWKGWVPLAHIKVSES